MGAGRAFLLFALGLVLAMLTFPVAFAVSAALGYVFGIAAVVLGAYIISRREGRTLPLVLGIVLLAVSLIALGALLFAHRKPVLALPAPSGLRRKGFIALSVSYGIAYAFASLTCSLPVFLMVIFAAASKGSTWLALFAYAAGFSAPMLLFALLATYSARYVEKMRRLGV